MMFQFSDGDHKKPLIFAMLHVPALPGTPDNHLSWKNIVNQVREEANLYADSGVDGVILENMHDRPYLNNGVGPEVTASMTRLAVEARRLLRCALGIQILAGANHEALATAAAADLEFIRVEGYVFAHIADEGWMDSCAGALLRSRRQWEANGVCVFTDIKKKHASHALTADVSLAETAQAAEYFRADGVILTGSTTGDAPGFDEAATVRAAVEIPVLIGSGVSSTNLGDFAPHVDAVIVGSSIKQNGDWTQPPDIQRLNTLLAVRDGLPEM